MSVIRRDTRLSVAAVVAAALIVGLALLYGFSSLVGESALKWADNIGDILGALACAALCLILWRSFHRGEVLRGVWGFLGIGLLMWGIAEIIYAYYDLTGGDVPTPSLADWLWVPGYIPIFIALYLRFRSLRIAPSRGQIIALGVAFTAAAVLSAAFVIAPNVEQTGSDPVGLALSILYPVGDLLIALGVGLTVMVLLGGQLSRPWMLIAAGCLSIALADSLYYYGAANGAYDSTIIPSTPVTAVSDVAYFGGYVLMALGLTVQARLQKIL